LAVFTKIPALAIIPLLVFLIYNGHNKNLKLLGVWFVPVVLIPLIWMAYSVSIGQFDLWLKDVLWQEHRHRTLVESITALFQVNPVLLILGFGGVAFAAIRRNLVMTTMKSLMTNKVKKNKDRKAGELATHRQVSLIITCLSSVNNLLYVPHFNASLRYYIISVSLR
jgi:hypothetical protein